MMANLWQQNQFTALQFFPQFDFSFDFHSTEFNTKPWQVVRSPIELPARVKTLDHFRLHEAKDGGISKGGVYKDQNDHKWMIKEPQFGDIGRGVKEYVAGGVYQKLMGAYAPQTELYVDKADFELKVGSKFLDNFSTLHDFKPFEGYWPTSSEILPTTYQGKPITNMANLLTSVIFMGDTDAHKGNVGVVEENNAWVISKIDHGFAFSNPYGGCTLGSFKSQLDYYGNYPLKEVGYQNLYDSIKMVVDIPFEEIKQLVESEFAQAQDYVDVARIYDPLSHTNMPALKQDILDQLQSRHESFAKILNELKVDDVIFHNDTKGLQTLLDNGLNPNAAIHPFHHNEPGWLGHEATKTPMQLAEIYHADDVMAMLVQTNIDAQPIF